jgi:hypothetical protein
MRIAKSSHESAVFVLTDENLENLLSQIAPILPDIRLSCACADGLERNFLRLDEMIAFRNPLKTSIKSITISALSEDQTDRFGIAFDSKGTRNLWVFINATEDVGLQLDQIANSVQDAIRPWYSPVAKADWVNIVLGLWLFSIFLPITISILRVGVSNVPWGSIDSVNIPTTTWIKAFAVALVPFVAGAVLNILRNRYFPMGTFAIGDGKSRFGRAEIIRTVVIVAFAISIASSVVAAVLL